MNVLNVQFSIDLKIGTGSGERTFQMTRYLAAQGVKCTVLTLDTGLKPERITALSPAVVVALGCTWRRFNLPRVRWSGIRQLVHEADIVHLMGHWTILNVLVYFAARHLDKPYVICPAGTLAIVGRSKSLKRLFNFLVGHAVVRNASAWIAVTAAECPQFEAYGVAASRVTVIPNAVSDIDFPVVDPFAFLHRQRLPTGPMILFMGRLEVIKGPDLLLNAFISVSSRIPDFHLVFAGPDGSMLSQLRNMADEGRVGERVHFLGHVQGNDKSGAYRFARLLVVPSRSEAMSIVALEAGICGTPVLITDQCGFSGVRSVDQRMEVSATVQGLADGLISLLADEAERQRVALSYHKFVEERYSWDAIGPRYVALYNKILHN